ncbi:MAG TPA: beta-ketoacyl-ACP synthase II [Polyangiaceae bacterium]|jgi:3-oxoacyl-[acyl-carrier-protein] synthase II|nr:beta-ketoacyl-ACP synthase II [Polyangiaceae bacterium]
MERVVITGIGLVTPVGVGTLEPWRALLAGESGVGPITRFDASRFRARIAGEVKGWDGSRWVEKKRLKEMDRFTEFALGATALAVKDASLELSEEERPRAGCIIGVGIGGLPALERTKETLVAKGPEKVSPYTIPAIISNLAAGQVSMAHHLEGPSYCTTSACSSGAHAIGEASQWIRLGKTDVMVAGGAEATISPVGIAGFEAMFALSRRNDEPHRASRPFDRGRDGFVCGEGAAVLVLESLSRARGRGARVYAELTGYGASSDAYHITQPLPSHRGAQRAMRMALAEARLPSDAVDYVNAHGTSTPAGDVEESRAIAEVFGARATDKALWVSSTKSMMGHLLGAAGAVETAVCALAIAEGAVPPTINLDDPDPECTLDYVPNTARRREVRHAMNNSFGFGGTNCALLLSRVSAEAAS